MTDKYYTWTVWVALPRRGRRGSGALVDTSTWRVLLNTDSRTDAYAAAAKYNKLNPSHFSMVLRYGTTPNTPGPRVIPEGRPAARRGM